MSEFQLYPRPPSAATIPLARPRPCRPAPRADAHPTAGRAASLVQRRIRRTASASALARPRSRPSARSPAAGDGSGLLLPRRSSRSRPRRSATSPATSCPSPARPRRRTRPWSSGRPRPPASPWSPRPASRGSCDDRRPRRPFDVGGALDAGRAGHGRPRRDDDGAVALIAAEPVLDQLEAWAARLSRFDAAFELGRLNAAMPLRAHRADPGGDPRPGRGPRTGPTVSSTSRRSTLGWRPIGQSCTRRLRHGRVAPDAAGRCGDCLEVPSWTDPTRLRVDLDGVAKGRLADRALDIAPGGPRRYRRPWRHRWTRRT